MVIPMFHRWRRTSASAEAEPDVPLDAVTAGERLDAVIYDTAPRFELVALAGPAAFQRIEAVEAAFMTDEQAVQAHLRFEVSRFTAKRSDWSHRGQLATAFAVDAKVRPKYLAHGEARVVALKVRFKVVRAVVIAVRVTVALVVLAVLVGAVALLVQMFGSRGGR